MEKNKNDFNVCGFSLSNKCIAEKQQKQDK